MRTARRNVIFRGMFLLLISTCTLIGFAQPAIDPYPTITALESVVIPPRDRVLLAQQLLEVGEIAAPPAVPALYSLGDLESFRYVNVGINQIFEVDAKLLGLGESIAVWVDTRAGVPHDEAQALADAFDTSIYPEVRDLWGSEDTPGIDGDPRVHALFTYDLGGPTAYFSGENTYPREVAASSNEREMFLFDLNQTGEQIGNRDIQSVMAHEFQHMIRHNIQRNMETWMNEGLSMYTQWHLGYPGSANPVAAYQSAPSTQLNTWGLNGGTGAHYGGALAFMIYFQDRFGLKALQHASMWDAAAFDAFDSAIAEMTDNAATIDEVFADWTLANWWNAPELAEGQYGYQELTVLPEPESLMIRSYPRTIEATANQYSATYYEFEGLSAKTTLSLDFSAAETVALVPTDAASGDWMWYGNRNDNSAPTLTRAFDLTKVTHAELEYRVWYELEPDWDYGYVLVSVDDGATWEVLTTEAMTDANPHGTAYGTGYTGKSEQWLEEHVSLDAYTGHDILLRFTVITDDATNFPGMVVDDVRLAAVDYASDFESDDGGWEAAGWLRIDNRLPQRVWVQVAQQNDADFQVTRWLYPDDADAMQVDVLEGVTEAVLVISPFAPVTTIEMPYTLTIR